VDVTKQILCVYQAFMVYIVNSWCSSDQDKECCEKLQKLFSKYNNILESVMVTLILLFEGNIIHVLTVLGIG